MVLANLFRSCTKVLSGYGLGKNRMIASAYYRIGKKMLPEFVLFNGYRIFLNSENSINLAAIGYDSERFELSLFESEIVNGSIILDIGANIGLYTLAAAKNATKVYSFEPDPVSFSNLKKNVEGNFYDNVVLVNKAVSNRNGQSKFFSPKKSSRGGSRLVTDYTNVECITVQLIALDDYFKNMKEKIDVVKMDIEGAELSALKGMENLIHANRDLKLFLEFNPHALTLQGTEVSSLLDYLENLEFHFYYIDEVNKTKKLVSKEWLLDFAKNKSYGHYINLFGKRKV